MLRVTVGPRTGGGWEVTGDARRFDTQVEAERAARQQLSTNGGGELVINGRDGRVQIHSTLGRPDSRRSKG